MKKLNAVNLTKEYFEGISQMLFFRNHFLGAALISLSLIFKPEIFLFGFLASLFGFGYSTLRRIPKILRSTGLLTINGFFFGIALAALFVHTPQFYLCFAIGTLAIPLITKASFEILQHWKLTPLIIPYILAVWVLYLCADALFLQYNPNSFLLHSGFLPTSLFEDHAWLQLIVSAFVSIGQIFFFQSLEFGMCLFLLVTAFSPRRGLFFFLGVFAATLVFYQLSGGKPGWNQGFLGYSAGLVGLGLASLPEEFSWKTIMLFCVLSLFLTLALSRLLGGLSLPVLSLPYVLTFWFALLSRVPRLNVNWSPPEKF